jgi:hypothetical protein
MAVMESVALAQTAMVMTVATSFELEKASKKSLELAMEAQIVKSGL